MMLTLFIIVASIGQLGEVFARSLIPSTDSGFERRDLVLRQDSERQMVQDSVSYFDNPENLVNIRIQEFNVDKGDPLVESKLVSKNILDEIEQLLVLVKTKATLKRDKRYIQQRSHLTPCLFKICNLGRKRQARVYS